MYEEFQKNNFVIVCNLIPKALIKEMYDTYMTAYNAGEIIEGESPPMFGTAIELNMKKGNPVFKKVESLLSNWLQENMGMRTIPTYSMGRIYTKETTGMLKHRDRVPCEVSVTLPIAYDNFPWAIYVKDPAGKEHPANLHVGDVLFYYGCRADHHRRKDSLNTFHIQHYFHFVDLDSEIGSFYNYFRTDRSNVWPGHLDLMMQKNDLPILSDEDKIRYSKLIGEDNV
jgi:hypothetical protein